MSTCSQNARVIPVTDRYRPAVEGVTGSDVSAPFLPGEAWAGLRRGGGYGLRKGGKLHTERDETT